VVRYRPIIYRPVVYYPQPVVHYYRPATWHPTTSVTTCYSSGGVVSNLWRSLVTVDTPQAAAYPTTVSGTAPVTSSTAATGQAYTPPVATARVPCTRCGGTGHVTIQGDWGPVARTCPDCGGRGYRTAETTWQGQNLASPASLPQLPR
jgi:hypothetical protein